jgi:vesicle coat protein
VLSSARPSEADLVRGAPLSSSMPASGVPGEGAAAAADVLLNQRARSSANSPVGSQRNLTDVSSFLSAKTVDPDGYPRVSRDLMRAKGLAEIVGNEKFFVELHAQFCVILYNLAAGLR